MIYFTEVTICFTQEDQDFLDYLNACVEEKRLKNAPNTPGTNTSDTEEPTTTTNK